MRKKRAARKGPATLKHPAVEDLKAKFRGTAMKSSLTIHLTQAMIEFLSAVADGVDWDRGAYYQDLPGPDCSLSTARALEKRGLVERKCQSEIEAEERHYTDEDFASKRAYETSNYRLTPAGEKLVDLLTVTGLFVEADMAIQKKARG